MNPQVGHVGVEDLVDGILQPRTQIRSGDEREEVSVSGKSDRK